MKKFLLTVALGLAMGTSAFAQVEFVDANGDIIPNGSTVVRNTIEQPVPGLEMYQIKAGINAKNTSSATVQVASRVDVTDLPFGQLPLCFPGSCWINVGDFTGTYPTHKPTQANLSADGPWTSPSTGTLAAGGTQNIDTEWKLNSLGQTNFDKDKDKGSFTATYSLLVGDKVVTTIKVLYSTDPEATSIAAVKGDAAGKQEVGRYTLDGQKMAAGAKGLGIVKYADGSAKKVVIK